MSAGGVLVDTAIVVDRIKYEYTPCGLIVTFSGSFSRHFCFFPAAAAPEQMRATLTAVTVRVYMFLSRARGIYSVVSLL